MKNNDIQAFPMRKQVVLQQGMTLRDYFAGKAMNAALSTPTQQEIGIERMANSCYEIADAMLKARKD